MAFVIILSQKPGDELDKMGSGFQTRPYGAYSYYLLLFCAKFRGGRSQSTIQAHGQRAIDDEAAAMNILHEVEHLLTKMTRAEKAQVLQWVVRDLGDAFPGIESRPGVSGGEACIVRTRIPVWVLVQSRHLGMSEADLLRSYPSLRAEDLANAWAYYRLHPDEIDQQIADNEAA